ncbi:MAG: undecaprenyldiphospho-muramoylpentapeptide beta-N-acetylglucosaminyltransferase, partial [Flavobacteriales bacterium]|nr:undecaprenyldiphospho-muramoylpentapeptide beta-N-acetylglucosaminyltransferase [Flavobacteriales bacterium]
GLWISGLQRKLTLKNLSFPFKVISSLIKARKIIKEFKPDIAIGVGGYASGPLLRAANSKGIRTLIQEQNSYPGITNKLLSSKTDRICVAYEGLERWFPKEKIVLTGNPIRSEVTDIEGKRNQAIEHFGLNPKLPIVFAMGGSLGARSINESIAGFAPQFEPKGVQILWQTGKLFIEQAEHITAAHKNIVTRQFIKEMDLAYAAADVIISRAGAMSISELCIIGKPAIFIPFPYASEDHQTKNAQALVSDEAAILIPDSEARGKLEETLFDLLADSTRRSAMSQNIRRFAKPNATHDIVDQVIQLIQ